MRYQTGVQYSSEKQSKDKAFVRSFLAPYPISNLQVVLAIL